MKQKFKTSRRRKGLTCFVGPSLKSPACPHAGKNHWRGTRRAGCPTESVGSGALGMLGLEKKGFFQRKELERRESRVETFPQSL